MDPPLRAAEKGAWWEQLSPALSAGYVGLSICCLCCSRTLSSRMRDVNYLKRQRIEELTWSKAVLYRRSQQILTSGNNSYEFKSYPLNQSFLVCFPLSYLPFTLGVHASFFSF